ncbi:MAG: hypothetical protein ACREQV_10750 [Candidatus Binatia bacterium]
MKNKRSINLICFDAQIHEVKAVQKSVNAGRVGEFLPRALRWRWFYSPRGLEIKICNGDVGIGPS